MQRVMALDVGDARVGVAVSDPLGLTASPLETIERRGGKAFERLEELVRRDNVGTIVVGKPLLMDGSSGEQAEKTAAFVKALERYLTDKLERQVAIVEWDERLTSLEAERHMQGRGLTNRKRRAMLDQLSAAIILEAYLQSRPPS